MILKKICIENMMIPRNAIDKLIKSGVEVVVKSCTVLDNECYEPTDESYGKCERLDE